MNCTIIKLKTVDQRLTFVQQPILASGDVGTVRVEYALDSFWSGYAASGTFYTLAHPEKVYEAPLSGGSCKIPWEVLTEEGVLFIGLRGVDGSGQEKTAAPVRYRIEKGSPKGGNTTVTPSPDVYQQILAIAAEARELAKSAQVASNGKDGISPTVEVTTITGGHRVTITDKNGAKSFDLLNGSGTVDTAEVVALVLAALPKAEGVSV